MIIIDAPDKIEVYRLLTIRAGLKLELKGFRHSRDMIFKAAKQATGQKTREKCLDSINEILKPYGL